jgi:HSP20 family molecular chaperone IbpA
MIMTDRQQVTKREGQEIDTNQAPDKGAIYVPDVDIKEDSDCIHLLANMPGVDQESVDVGVENGVLTIEGRVRIDNPQGYDLVGQEFGNGRYRRDFTLSDVVDAENIKARMRQGVLDVTIPKNKKGAAKKIRIET